MAHPFLPSRDDELSVDPPFALVSEQLELQPNGNFRPSAHVAFDATLRTSGFLLSIPPDELQLLLLLLSFVTPNANCHLPLVLLAQTLNVSPGKAKAQMERLVRFAWHGQPLVNWTQFQGHPALSPTLALITHRTALPADQSSNEPHAPPRVFPRERPIAFSRAAYARPRAEVEREIARLNGWPEPPFDVPSNHPLTPPAMHNPTHRNDEILDQAGEEALVRDQLLRVGLNDEQADSLLERFDLLRIRRQLSWLNYHRGVRNRAGFLLAAVADDYEAPLALRVKPEPVQATEEDAMLPIPEEPLFEPDDPDDLPPLNTSAL